MWFGKGDKVRIAEMSGLSVSTVRKVFSGNVVNYRVLESAILLLEKRKRAIENIRKL